MTFLPFHAPWSSFFWLFLFSDLLSSSFLFSDSSHLCFFHTVGNLTSKLPSITKPANYNAFQQYPLARKCKSNYKSLSHTCNGVNLLPQPVPTWCWDVELWLFVIIGVTRQIPFVTTRLVVACGTLSKSILSANVFSSNAHEALWIPFCNISDPSSH